MSNSPLFHNNPEQTVEEPPSNTSIIQKQPKLKTKKPKPSIKQTTNIDSFTRKTLEAPGSSPGNIIFTYFERVKGYDFFNFVTEQTDRNITYSEILDVFDDLKKVKYYNYMEIYYEVSWFNYAMVIMCIF